MTTLDKVREFHKTFGHPVNQINEVESLKTRQLRIKLLFEELSELADASDVKDTFLRLCSTHVALRDWKFGMKDGDKVDRVEELDALCDIQYVLDGKKLTSGLHEVFDLAFDRVHQNNMGKAHRNGSHVSETADKTDLELSYKEVNGKFIAYNQSGKVIKPYDFVKVGLEDLVIETKR